MGLTDKLSGMLAGAGEGALGAATAVGGAAMIGGQAADAIKPIAEAAIRDPLQEETRNAFADMDEERIARIRMERLQRSMAMNTARLAALDPHTYNEVLAGRRLARGSVVFGGTPRADLMERLAERMANGQMNEGV